MWATRREAEEEIFGNETSFDNDWTPYDKPTVIRLKEKRDVNDNS
jgi:hypothetical protein